MDIINYKFDLFEGPLDLLITLVAKNKMKIDDIPIDILCEQYMEYIREAEEHNIDLACEFLYMASELMLIKSRMLLPRDENDTEDPRKPLVDAIYEYQRAKLAASELSESYLERIVKEQDDVSPDRTYVRDHSSELLRAALMHVLSEVRLSSTDVKEKFAKIVNAPVIPVGTVMTGLVRRLKSSPVFLDEYFAGTATRSEAIAKFIGILELLKMHVISVEEEETTDETGVTNILSHIKITLLSENAEEITATLDSYT